MKNIYLYRLYTIFLFLFYAVVAQADVTQIEISDFNKGRIKLSSDDFKKLMERAKSLFLLTLLKRDTHRKFINLLRHPA